MFDVIRVNKVKSLNLNVIRVLDGSLVLHFVLSYVKTFDLPRPVRLQRKCSMVEKMDVLQTVAFRLHCNCVFFKKNIIDL